jgi:serine phosphatase RsbU (regulator of sigma subunit)/anti-sigma regulatory factor (Ser/Thr protein kinase)/integral membrane sensor domain MASE1
VVATTQDDLAELEGFRPVLWSWPSDRGLSGVLGLFLLSAALYAVGSGVALQLIELSGLDGVFYIPAGITLAFLLRLPTRMWWVVLIAAFVTEYVADVLTGFTLAQSAGFAAANVAEPLLGAAIVTTTCGVLDLARRRHVVWFTIGAVTLGPLVGGLMVAMTDRFFGGDDFWMTLFQVWLGDALGVIVIGGVVLVWGSSPDRRSVFSYWGGVILFATVALTAFVLIFTDQPLAFAGLIGIAIAGALFGIRAVAVTGFAVSLTLALVLSLGAPDVLLGLDQGEALVLIKLQVATFTLAGFLIAAEAHEREAALRMASRADLAARQSEVERRRGHDLAVRVQRSLLPDSLIDRKGIRLAAHYEAGAADYEVGGDWYDSFELPDGRVGLVVGDIVGHGIDAMTSMGRLRTALVALAMNAARPAELMGNLDIFVGGPDGTAYATVFYVIVDLDSNRVTYASAGHPPALLIRRSGDSEWLDGGLSGPLQGDPTVPREDSEAEIGSGDVLILYSDGLIERRGESLTVGLARLQDAARRSELDPESMCRNLIAELDPAGRDDVAILVFQVSSPPASIYRTKVPAAAGELRHIRASVRSWLSEHEADPDLVDDLLLTLGEATSNVVRHAYQDRGSGDVSVEITKEGPRFEVVVTDTGRWVKPREVSSGYGIDIISAVSDSLVIEETVQGTRVRFVLESPA